MNDGIKYVLGFAAGFLLCGCDSPNTTHAPRSTAAAADNSTSPATSQLVAMAILSPASGSQVRGTVSFTRDKDMLAQDRNMIRVEGRFSGLTPGKHGFHIHEKGDCSAPDASSAGGHFNPLTMPHAGPGEKHRHLGDLGNVEADASGNAQYSRTFSDLKFDGEASILGKAVIVHEKEDDLKTQPHGDAGARVACGVIEKR